jgi:monoamine oxidase
VAVVEADQILVEKLQQLVAQAVVALVVLMVRRVRQGKEPPVVRVEVQLVFQQVQQQIGAAVVVVVPPQAVLQVTSSPAVALEMAALVRLLPS